MAAMGEAGQDRARPSRGFRAAGALLADRIRAAGEKRGFALVRLLTRWPEIVGEDIARLSRPLRIGYAREGFGATLTLLVAPASAPVVQMQLPAIREKVNACYGYAAIARIVLTQTAPRGFADGQSPFAPAAPPPAPPAADPDALSRVAAATAGIADPRLRSALEGLGRSILTRRTGSTPRQVLT